MRIGLFGGTFDPPHRGHLAVANAVRERFALDRVLLEGYYVIPNWYLGSFRIAYWDKFGRPRDNPPYSLALNTWWYDKARADALAAERK